MEKLGKPQKPPEKIPVKQLGFNPSVRYSGGTGEVLPKEVDKEWVEKKLVESQREFAGDIFDHEGYFYKIREKGDEK